tara:strand:- start:3012 stop:3227 length:216 start_codon:yes stop_codon:yes gene_type:complete
MLRGLLERRVRPPSVDGRLRRRSALSETSQLLIIDTVRFAGHLYLWTKILRFVRIHNVVRLGVNASHLGRG